MLEHGLGWKVPFENLTPLYFNPGDKNTHAYQHDQYLSQVRFGLNTIKDVHTRIPINNSKDRTGRPWSGSAKARTKRTSHDVRRTPPQIGSLGKSRLRAIAEPRSSAKSVLMMAISEMT
jgi:hypothetical protein